MTKFLTDKRSEQMREKQGVVVETIVRNAEREVIESGELTFTPQVFLIDSLPLDANERRTSEKCRSSILDYIQHSLKPIPLKDMKVAKTAALKRQDEKEIGCLDGEIHGYNNCLIQANKNAESALNDIECKRRKISELKGEIQHLKSELDDKDSTTTVTAKTWSLSSSWKWFQSQSQPFDVSSAWPIVEYTKWDNGHLEWTDFRWSKDPGHASGKVEGTWFRGLYANLTLLTEKREKFKEEIRSLKRDLEIQTTKLKDLTEDLAKSKLEESRYKKEIDLLYGYIEERSERKEYLMADPIPIEEAYKRLADLTQYVQI